MSHSWNKVDMLFIEQKRDYLQFLWGTLFYFAIEMKTTEDK